MSNNFDEVFNDEKLNKAIKKGKRKATIKTIIISLIVVLIVLPVGNAYNTKISIKMSEEAFEREKEYVMLTVPNGYISQSIDTIGFLGGRGTYKISKAVGPKPVVISDSVSVFGLPSNNKIVKLLNLYPKGPITRAAGGREVREGEYISYSTYGYRKMKFFHPEISYSKYQNDLKELDKLSENQLIEMGVSFDKPYKEEDMTTVMGYTKRSWYWVDVFLKEDLDRFKKEANYIPEFNAIGVPVFTSGATDDFATSYEYSLIDILKNTKLERYSKMYKELEAKGYKSYADMPILGAVVYGTKSELKQLLNNPHIKASSFGVITSLY